MSVVGTDNVNRYQVYGSDGKFMYAGVTTSSAPGVRYIYLNRHLIAEVNGSATTFNHTDVLGSPVATTSNSSTTPSHTHYEPYGKTAGGFVPSIGFTGHVNASDIGLVYMQQRYYDPVAGRFLSLDPMSTDANTSANFNRFNYAANSPYAFIDPDGRQAEPPVDREAERQREREAKERERFCGPSGCDGDTIVRQPGWAESLGSYIPGTATGASSAQYWADRQVDTGNPLYAIPGAVAALWTPETAVSTAMTLAMPYIGGRFAGSPNNWIRIGPSYSHAAGRATTLSIRWGASPAKNGKYLKQIPNENLRAFNQWLRSKRIPGTSDPGHIHLWD